MVWNGQKTSFLSRLDLFKLPSNLDRANREPVLQEEREKSFLSNPKRHFSVPFEQIGLYLWPT